MKNRVPVVIIGNACLWGFAVIMTSVALKGTDCYAQIQNILVGCAAFSSIVGGYAVVWAARKE